MANEYFDKAVDTFAVNESIRPVTVMGENVPLIRDSSTGSVAVAMTTAFAVKWRPTQVTAHASAAVTGALNVYFKSKTGVAYKTLLATVATGWTDGVWFPDIPVVFAIGDELSIECVNSGGATISVDVLGEEVD